jgi:hypothetical protein
MKLGASTNYYFTHLSLLSILAVSQLHTLKISFLIKVWWYISVSLLFFMIILMLLGKIGRVSLFEQHRTLSQLKECVQSLPQPVLVYDRFDHYASLPWMNPAQLHFVRATTYYYTYEFPEEHVYQYGGIDGLIKRGYFQAVVYEHQPLYKTPLPNSTQVLLRECTAFEVWLNEGSL